MDGLFDTLRERGYIAGFSEPEAQVRELLDGQTAVYQGFDPTSASLHVGHLQSLMIFRRLQDAGHRLIFLIGGATALVGDPSGRDAGRPQLGPETVAANAAAIRRQVEGMGLVRFDEASGSGPAALLLNNADWLDLGLLTYLREVASRFSVNALTRQETFSRRLQSGLPLSLQEFLYPSLQAYDFLHLLRNYNCRLQMGGSDQWGNIAAGIEFVRQAGRETVHGLVFPLLVERGTGQKMGKTGTGQTVWLDAARTSPFQFYQYWLTCPDAELARNLALFTFLPLETVHEVAAGDPRAAQHRLAFEVTRVVHGQAAAERAATDARAAFGRDSSVAPADVPTLRVAAAELAQAPALAALLVAGAAVPSMSWARRLIEQGAVRLNGERVADVGRRLTADALREAAGETAALVQYGRGKVLKIALAD